MRINSDDVEWDESGRALVGNSYITGEVVEYDADGKLIARITYRNGWQDGPERQYYPDGSLKSEGFWVYGGRRGRRLFWHPNGQLADELEYDRGQVVRIGRWDEKGVPVP